MAVKDMYVCDFCKSTTEDQSTLCTISIEYPYTNLSERVLIESKLREDKTKRKDSQDTCKICLNKIINFTKQL